MGEAFSIQAAYINRFPECLGITHKKARKTVSDHASVVVVLGAETDHSAVHYECGTKRYCRQMKSCAEARFYLEQCGLSRLDGDGDGTPCEALCR